MTSKQGGKEKTKCPLHMKCSDLRRSGGCSLSLRSLTRDDLDDVIGGLDEARKVIRVKRHAIRDPLSFVEFQGLSPTHSDHPNV